MKTLLVFFMVMVLSASVQAQEVSRWAFGLSSDEKLLRTSDPALSVLYFHKSDHFIQGNFVMTSSDPSQFSLGAYYKINMLGTLRNGFHVGVGYGTGTFSTDRSFWRLNGNVGTHFIVAARVLLSFDASLSLGKDLDPSESVFTIGGNSPFMGVSLLWIP